MTRWPWIALALLATAAPGCDGSNGGDDDAGADGDADAAEAGPERIGGLRADPEFVGLQPGETRTVRLWVQAVPGNPITIDLVSDDPAVASVPASVEIAAGGWSADFEVEGLAVGTAEVTATYDVRTAIVTADVVSPEVSCAGDGSGTLGPGATVQGTGGLDEASITMGPTATIEPFDVTIGCAAADIVPAGYTAIGPAVTFGPARRFLRELEFSIPAKAGLVPERVRVGELTIFYTDGRIEPRAVPMASVWLDGSPGGGTLRFSSTRLGTFQAAYETDVRTRTRTRRWTYKGIVGVSMGGGGSGSIGLRNPERFDFVAPLGGPINWTHMRHYVEDYYLGGFCTASPDDEGDVGEHCAPPPSTQPFEQVQEFENWYYPDGRDGQGGTFDRREYCQIFRDMSLAFGNPGMYNVESVYLPPGVPHSWWEMSAEDRCATPVVLDDFYDDEYNPDGTFQVITFCDGAEIPGDHGRWDPDGRNDYPLDVGLAVDIDGDTVRDPGEPVIRSGREPYDDVGVDGVASALEPGYDALTNPDPNDDDFDYQFNPGGTEGNWRWDGPAGTDPGEPWVDAGIDGVLGTLQQGEGGYDWGEDNGVYDESPNFAAYLAHDGAALLRDMPDAQLDRIEILADAGIRDLFPFAPGEDAMLGELAARGRPVRFYNDFSATYGMGSVDEQLDPKKIAFRAVGRHTMIRYGSPDPTEEMLIRGDGGHVGTVTQVLNRLAYATFAMSARWPDGDRRRTATDTAATISSHEFVDSTGRTSPYSLILPPGYSTEAYASVRYPVIFFLHGYGQEPQDLVASAIIFQNWMIAPLLPEDLRMQKLIMVFPDGRCRDPDETPDHARECIRGTFYADSVRPDGPQMETMVLELMDYIDATYRTKLPEDVDEIW